MQLCRGETLKPQNITYRTDFHGFPRNSKADPGTSLYNKNSDGAITLVTIFRYYAFPERKPSFDSSGTLRRRTIPVLWKDEVTRIIALTVSA